MSIAYLGILGTSIGWGLFQIFMIGAVTLFDVVTGARKHSSRSAHRPLTLGLYCLAVATVLLATGNR